VPQRQHEPGLPLQGLLSGDPPPALEAKTDIFLVNRFAPHWGHAVPCHRLERTRISLSAPHFSQ